jgi:hypothetical protein
VSFADLGIRAGDEKAAGCHKTQECFCREESQATQKMEMQNT